jgi:hypothetical protein
MTDPIIGSLLCGWTTLLEYPGPDGRIQENPQKKLIQKKLKFHPGELL